MNKQESKAWNDGFEAQTHGASKESNPHPKQTPSHEFWAIGWQDGADEDIEDTTGVD